jgi:hypothetical protein
MDRPRSNGDEQVRSDGETAGCEDGRVSRKPSLRVRKSGALLVAALIAFVGTVPLAGARWALAPILLIPLGVGLWAWRAGTDVYPDRLRVRALFGSTDVLWSRVTELAPDQRGRISALLDNGNTIRLTGITTANLPSVLAAAGQDVSTPPPPD